jgi:hypothetical protein
VTTRCHASFAPGNVSVNLVREDRNATVAASICAFPGAEGEWDVRLVLDEPTTPEDRAALANPDAVRVNVTSSATDYPVAITRALATHAAPCEVRLYGIGTLPGALRRLASTVRERADGTVETIIPKEDT